MTLLLMWLSTALFIAMNVADVITTNHPGGVEGNAIVAKWMQLTGKWWWTIKSLALTLIAPSWYLYFHASAGYAIFAAVVMLGASASLLRVVIGNMKINGQIKS